ncbi:MAG TPA: Rieske 2Fe-2S domain-containing protein [Acidimicrobiales bacterium]|nr:Rieske 2Fe-2S domain-containing protein [Acidimicrobiales bacterium]
MDQSDGALGRVARPLRDLPARLEGVEALDGVVGPLRDLAGRVAKPASPANTALSGTWMGHPLHPLLTDVAIGSFTSALLMDLVGGRKRAKAADRLIFLGLIAAVPTAASGLNDWQTLSGPESRVGVVHAASNAVATTLFGASWYSRKRGRRLRGRLLALAGAGATAMGGFLGGHLSYRRGVGVDRSAFAPDEEGWTTVAEESELTESAPVRVDLGGLPVMVVRHQARIYALANQCAHQGGPLCEGKVADGQVTCPWHGSTFRLADGEALTGPSAHPQRSLQVRIQGGKVDLRL